MYGIPDFEDQVRKVSTSDLAPLLSNELGRIPWQKEKEEFLPKLIRNKKFVYKNDFLSDRIIEQQERFQNFQGNLAVKEFSFVVT